ncbi:MAG TPA: c-type cytochrome [Aggregatilineales bacterium]|nr:c-type cytochrome [Anaerolineales bacterium]HRE49622.1 c-type cytochrome [Aggregatilineales bacterium]
MKIENKILLGIGFFVGIMLLVGWIAINEPVRMEVFTQQWQGRSIERGADLYLNLCSTCHGQDALGAAGVAPALKNPYLFLTENPAKVAQAEANALIEEKASLESALQNFEENATKLAEKQKEFDAETDPAKKAELQKELDSLNAAIRLFGDRAATEKQIADLTETIAEKQTALDDLIAQGWDATTNVRLKEMNSGDLKAYLRATLIAGRPLSIYYGWTQAMPAWSQMVSGPLREDEIENLVNYIVNYREQAIKLTPKDLRQGFKLPAEAGAAGEGTKKAVIGEKPNVEALDLAGGDATKGETLFTRLACAACHSTSVGAAYAAASTAGMATRVEAVRLKLPEFAGYTVERYLAESILYPNKYIVPGGVSGIMPQTFATQLTLNDLQDLIAYIETNK